MLLDEALQWARRCASMQGSSLECMPEDRYLQAIIGEFDRLQADMTSTEAHALKVERERDAARGELKDSEHARDQLRMAWDKVLAEVERLRGLSKDLLAALPGCSCHAAYIDRGLVDPDCQAHDYEDEAAALSSALASLAEPKAEPASERTCDGVERIRMERDRQKAVEGWTPEHDDQHAEGQLALAAAAYATPIQHRDLLVWPWAIEWWKPGSRMRDLEKAGALIAAEIDRIIRLQTRHSASEETP